MTHGSPPKGGQRADVFLVEEGFAATRAEAQAAIAAGHVLADGTIESPILGGDGNREYLVAARKP